MGRSMPDRLVDMHLRCTHNAPTTHPFSNKPPAIETHLSDSPRFSSNGLLEDAFFFFLRLSSFFLDTLPFLRYT